MTGSLNGRRTAEPRTGISRWLTEVVTSLTDFGTTALDAEAAGGADEAARMNVLSLAYPVCF